MYGSGFRFDPSLQARRIGGTLGYLLRWASWVCHRLQAPLSLRW